MPWLIRPSSDAHCPVHPNDGRVVLFWRVIGFIAMVPSRAHQVA